MDPEEAARLVVLDALKRDTALFVAMQYLKLIDSELLHRFFGDDLVVDDPVAAIIAAAPALPPPPTVRTYEIVQEAPRRSPPEHRPHWVAPATPHDIARWATRSRPSAAEASRARSDFSRWCEGEIDYYPGVAGSVD